MPAVVNQQTDRVERPSQYEWSWPDHPAGMSDSDARMRYPRGMREGSAVDAPLKDTDLAVAYGELLADGAAHIQQKTYTGDNLPRDSFGSLLEVRQQMAAEIAERRNGLEPGAYTTDRTRGMREPGPIASRYGATDGRQLATWVPSSEKPDRAIKAIRDNDAATNSRDASDIASCIGKNLDDNGEIWRHAIKVGRSVTGLASALETAAQRAPENVKVKRSKGSQEYSISVEKGQVTVNAPLPKGNRRADTAEELYAKARGTIAAAYGEPQNETEHALDALAASIVTSPRHQRVRTRLGAAGARSAARRRRGAAARPLAPRGAANAHRRRRGGVLPAVAGQRDGDRARRGTRRGRTAEGHLRLRPRALCGQARGVRRTHEPAVPEHHARRAGGAAARTPASDSRRTATRPQRPKRHGAIAVPVANKKTAVKQPDAPA